MSLTISACHFRTLMVGVGCYLLGAGELAYTDLQTIFGASSTLLAGAWKYIEAQRAAAPAEGHDHA